MIRKQEKAYVEVAPTGSGQAPGREGRQRQRRSKDNAEAQRMLRFAEARKRGRGTITQRSQRSEHREHRGDKEKKNPRAGRRGVVTLERKSPPFAGKREGWGTLKFRGLGDVRRKTQEHRQVRSATDGRPLKE